MNLWNLLSDIRTNCKWIELSREVSLATPHHSAFPDMKMEYLYNYDRNDGFQAHYYSMPGQYGTHIDAPIHMNENGVGLDAFAPEELLLPLCVINLADEVAKNPDYALSVADIEAYEAKNGRIPEGAFVAFRSDWCKKKTYPEIENFDEAGVAHYPGWTVEALKFLLEERKITAIGHEPADTDPAAVANSIGWVAEGFWLGQNRYQVELLANLDQCPEKGALILVTFPKIKDGSGFTSRCFAICEK